MVKPKPIDELICEHALFADIGRDMAALMSSCAQNQVFSDGDTILEEGASADQFFLVRAGRVALETFVPGRGNVIFQTLKAGEALGLSWLVPPYRWDFNAKAVGTVRTIAFDAKCLRDKSEADPRIGYAFLKCFMPALVDRLRTARIRALDVYAAPVPAAAGADRP